jgi:hypothetical protein
MRKINLKSTEDTPHVEYHDGENILRISGRSSSGRYILELLSTLEKKGIDNVKVVWCAEKDDELMVEKGEEFSSLVDLPFEIKVA